MDKILVVGAGLAGAVYARTLAEAGHAVTVIDKRPHIAGNCYDEVDANGVVVHHYGPHIFHTSNLRVAEWLSRFTEWVPYEHRVVARLPDGRLLPLPVNLDTVNGLFGLDLSTSEQVSAHLKSVSVAREPIGNAEDWLYGNIGPDLTNLFFRPYTQKMWDRDLSELSEKIVQRIKIRFDREPRYFPNDSFQFMPAGGYTKMIGNILNHKGISILLREVFSPAMLHAYDFCFNSMPIDEYFNFELGELPYRSIRFHVHDHAAADAPDHVVINYTDAGPFTRETWWHNMPGHHAIDTGRVTRTVEEPCDYKDNNLERYYPVMTSDGRYGEIYQRYRALASGLGNIAFIGRCGTYQYLDMDQVVNQSLAGVEKWLEARNQPSAVSFQS